MKNSYNHTEIEKKWQKYWLENKTFKSGVDRRMKKYYALDMFPYPSGAGLHVGHVVGYTGSDVVSRYKRQRGYNVLHPMGWDSFGLPAEQYAMRTGQHPGVTTEKNIETYKRQLSALGLSYDWDREITTSDSKYYKWTQWIFTKLYEMGLAVQEEIMVNFCPTLGTVLANEEVEDGKSIEGGYDVERRALKQWVLKITEYAQRLLDDLDDLDWPEHLKKMQRNWIGRSEGLNIDFAIEGSDEKICCFTTRQDTIFGVTYLVLAPENPLLDKICTRGQKKFIKEYQKLAGQKTNMQRSELNKDKTGVFSGAYALHPITNKKLPIWIADYVLMSYATGSVMAVPAHDDRDLEFSMKYGLEKKEVLDEEGVYINSSSPGISLDGLNTQQEGKKIVSAYFIDRSLGTVRVNYKLRDWVFSRQRYWGEPFPILTDEQGNSRALGIDELPLTPPIIEDYKPSKAGQSPISNARSWVEVIDPKTGNKAFRQTDTMPQWAGSCWYYLRFCDPLNEGRAFSKESQDYWMPVDLYIGGVEHATLHLLYARFWHKVLFDAGIVSQNEPFKSLRNQGLVTAYAYKKEGGGYVKPDEVKKEGSSYHSKKSGARLEKMLEKMSKSKLNGVSPDEIVKEIGADALRLYELFMTPFDKEKIWNSEAAHGCKRFLDRIYHMVTSDKVKDEKNQEALKLIHRLIKGVQEDIESLSFNTAIAKMMEFVNHFEKLEFYPKIVLKSLTQLLSPFAPHIAEELWQLLGERGGISYVPFPTYKEQYLQDESVTVVVQVMGRVRAKLEFAVDASEAQVLEKAKEHQNVSSYLKTGVKKVFFVPNKLLNIVTNA
jgi:leucyl-tRNA synthetase